MAVPKQRHTKSRRNKRRMHLFIREPSLGHCTKCAAFVRSHTLCLNCGYYKGEEIIDVMKKLTKKERKQKEKDISVQGEEQARSKPLDMEDQECRQSRPNR